MIKWKNIQFNKAENKAMCDIKGYSRFKEIDS